MKIRRALLGTPSLSENLIYKKSLTMVGNLFVFNKNLKFWVHMRHALLPFILVEQTLSISAWDVHQNSPQALHLLLSPVKKVKCEKATWLCVLPWNHHRGQNEAIAL
ncbi:hypothetical protein AV530_001739 [Patagioenas fasciata monilis]|uniref:Uncharacterized protein n=1 Tax=Patagioenas fasciata monilis TaxID=372326 RepID=A0A1V4KM95_PATFA|nr:hypothetical protein AV530_001739 [Patagioenas fasciata monilis]